MKRICLVFITLFMLSGCGRSDKSIHPAMDFRTKVLQADSCSFIAVVTADYEQILHTFKLKCSTDRTGAVTFEVLSPESIAGISGQIAAEAGKLTFDDHALMFSLLADGRYSPVCAPWIVMRAIRTGYIQGCELSADKTVVHLQDSYCEDALEIHVCLNTDNDLTSAEIFYKGTRILSVSVENFKIL